jgi:uncharacterized protein YbcI
MTGEISNGMVALYKRQFGRGPTKAWTHFAGPDCLVTSLEDSFTPAERKLADLGEYERLREIRLFFQHASDNEFIAIIEEATGRKVRAFISGLDAEKDVSAELFYLEPVAGAGNAHG